MGNTKPNIKSQIRHELITPLSCILGMLDCLGETHVTSQQKNCLQHIRKSAMTLLHADKTIHSIVQNYLNDYQRNTKIKRRVR